MIKLKYYSYLFLFLVLIFPNKGFSDSHNLKEVIELIQKDLKTLERAVYSDSFSLSDEQDDSASSINQNSEEVFGLNILGLLYIKKDQVLEAVKIFKNAILINPKYPDSYNNLGKCYIDIEKLNLAYLNFKKSYKINPNSELPLINIANILSLKDKNKLAIRFYEKAKNKSK